MSVAITTDNFPKISYLSPDGTIHSGSRQKFIIDGKEVLDKLIPTKPEENSDEYSLKNIEVENPDGTYGEWVQDLEKVKLKYMEMVKIDWLKTFTTPLVTSYGFSVQQSKEDLDLWRDGILKRAIEFGTKGEVSYTEEEQKDLSVGNLTGSVFDKIKSKTMTIRDYDNALHSITIEEARLISHLQATAIDTNFSIKWSKQNLIKNATTIEEVKSIYKGI